MENNKHFYSEIYNLDNLILAWRKARKHKTKRYYVIEFEKDLFKNLLIIQKELKNKTYSPLPLKTFILCDPKTRKISKSDFRDRIVHHALVRVIEPIFDKSFIHDSCANRIGKGNTFALKRFDFFKRKVSCNETKEIYCLKADIKHYFDEINHKILIDIVKRKINDKRVIWLVTKILDNGVCMILENSKKGMPLGNLTSQFFANVYLNDFDYFIKHKLKAKYYIRYVDDFVILHSSKKQLILWKSEIDRFLRKNLKIELHLDKSKIISLSRGVDFVGFRNFYYHKLLRKRNIRKMLSVIQKYKEGYIPKEKIIESFQGWQAYAKWANSFKLRKEVAKKICALNAY